MHGTTRIPCLCSNLAGRVHKTTISGSCLRGTSGKSAASEDFTWCARRTLPQVEPCCGGLLPICTPISQPHGWHDRGAVLGSMKNQQEEDCACGRVRRAHHVFLRHRMRNRPPSLACACREPRRKVQRRRVLLGAHGAPTAGGAVLWGLLPFSTPISQPHGLHGCCCRLATLAGKALLAGG